MKVFSEEERLYLPHSTTCFICGSNNPVGPKCRFFTTEGGKVYLYANMERKYAGYTDVIHGGIQTAMLDEAMGWCGFTQTDSEVFFFTRDISVKFRRGAVSGRPLYIETSMTDYKRGFVHTQGVMTDDSGTVLTTASGIFVPIPAEKMSETFNNLLYIDDGRKYFEKAIRVCNPQPVSE